MHMHTCKKQPLFPQESILPYEIRLQEWSCVFSNKLKVSSGAGLPARAAIRTCNIKALGFQRLSFTANFRSPGSYVSRQLIKGCFHHHLPIQHPESSLTTTGAVLSGNNADTTSGFLCRNEAFLVYCYAVAQLLTLLVPEVD